MSDHLFIRVALLNLISTALPVVAFAEEWKAEEDGSRPGLFADEALKQLPVDQVVASIDEHGRHLFLVNHLDTINVLQARGDGLLNQFTEMFFDGSEAVAGILETAHDGGGVTLSNLQAFFLFFGPDEVRVMLEREMADFEAGDILQLSDQGPGNATSSAVELGGAEVGDVVPNPNRLMMMLREPRTIILDTGWKKVGAAGVIAFAVYGVFRWARG